MKIKNINGTSDNKCNCDSWLDHWKKFSGQTMPFCPVENCMGHDLVGAHVQKDYTNDNNWYILPLCTKHNGEKGKSLSIRDNCHLVSANVSETCGKK